MRIEKLTAENFRNFDLLDVSFDDINIIYGENAQGKTNLIEAIYLFSGAKSFRGVSDKELIKFDKDYFKLTSDFENRIRSQNAVIKYADKKEIYINGIKKRSSDLGKEFKTVIFSPVHLSMIKDGPSQRRRFVDSALYQIKASYKKLINEYNRCIKQRNTLLCDIASNSSIYDMLDIWDANTAKTGAKIIWQRNRYIELLQPKAQEFFNGISGGKENIKLSLECGFECSDSLSDIENRLLCLFNKSRGIDIGAKTTTIGPHRNDIKILINGISARKYGSQGQQRSCVLALKLAEAELLHLKTEESPVILLDDVMSELDEKRQNYILNNMTNRQIFITCCDADTVLRLKKGKTIKMSGGCACEN